MAVDVEGDDGLAALHDDLVDGLRLVHGVHRPARIALLDLAAVEAWAALRRQEVDRVRMAVQEIVNSGLTLSKLSVAANLLGDLVRN